MSREQPSLPDTIPDRYRGGAYPDTRTYADGYRDGLAHAIAFAHAESDGHLKSKPDSECPTCDWLRDALGDEPEPER